MDCPVCKNVQLLMSDRQGIEIDYCPNCRGVWLDRGELDKIIDRSAGAAPAPQQAHQAPYEGQQHQPGYGYPQQPHGHPQQRHHKKKREGFLGELFDFD
jgi:Zn-finger nucleic acid-binding protein